MRKSACINVFKGKVGDLGIIQEFLDSKGFEMNVNSSNNTHDCSLKGVKYVGVFPLHVQKQEPSEVLKGT